MKLVNTSKENWNKFAKFTKSGIPELCPVIDRCELDLKHMKTQKGKEQKEKRTKA